MSSTRSIRWYERKKGCKSETSEQSLACFSMLYLDNEGVWSSSSVSTSYMCKWCSSRERTNVQIIMKLPSIMLIQTFCRLISIVVQVTVLSIIWSVSEIGICKLRCMKLELLIFRVVIRCTSFNPVNRVVTFSSLILVLFSPWSESPT